MAEDIVCLVEIRGESQLAQSTGPLLSGSSGFPGAVIADRRALFIFGLAFRLGKRGLEHAMANKSESPRLL